ncbi:hypothetical protein ACRS8P_05640 [Burkholderia cenocepacia]
MTLSELFRAIRQPYADLLAKAATQLPAHIEPACRHADGTLATEGPLALPWRADYIPTEGEAAGRPARIDSFSRLEFEPISFEVEAATVSIGPFAWDRATIEVDGLAENATIDLFKSWFCAWFDADDARAPGEDGLHGVVHSLSEPARIEEGWRVNVDFGSAPETAAEDVLFRLVGAGATRISLGSGDHDDEAGRRRC